MKVHKSRRSARTLPLFSVDRVGYDGIPVSRSFYGRYVKDFHFFML